MSVMLLNITGVYQDMATAYAGLKQALHQTADDEQRFYRALRRMYYANVAAFLCQYHDDTPLSEDKLTSIDTVQHIPSEDPSIRVQDCAQLYLEAWWSLKYNTVTNDGEVYKAEDSYALLQALSESMTRLALAL